MTRRKAISVLIALALIVLTIPTSKAVVDEWVTGLCDEDLFIASYLFDGVDMVYLQGDEAQIRGWYWFEAPILMYGRYIIEAYLEVRTPSIGATDLNASMTIYGKPSGKGGTPSYYEDPHAINGPYTTNSYTVNLSSFVGPGVLHNITVTKILREINQGYYFWNGHDIAFVTLSTDNHDEERTVYSEESGYPAKLYIHYGEPDYPPGLPPGGVVVEEYRNYTIWEILPNDVNYTEMTQTGSLGLLHVFNESCFNWTNINKNTANVALGYFVNQTGPDTINGIEIDFNFTVHVDIHNAAQQNAAVFYMMGENDAIGSATDVYASNELIIFDLYTVSLDWYRFLPRKYGTGAGFGGYSGNLRSDRSYMGKITLDGTLWRFEISEMSGVPATSCFHTLPFVHDIKAIMPFAAQENVYGSQVDGWQKKYIEPSTLLVTDANGTVITTWNGENFTDVDDLKDFIDEEVIGYPNPEDPNPPGWDDDPGLLTIHNFKLIIFMIGMVLLAGTPVYGFASRPEAATWVLILFSMLCGVALLWSLQTM